MKDNTRMAVIGDTQKFELDFVEAKSGETWSVVVQVKRPDGYTQAYYYDYKFDEPVELRGKK